MRLYLFIYGSQGFGWKTPTQTEGGGKKTLWVEIYAREVTYWNICDFTLFTAELVLDVKGHSTCRDDSAVTLSVYLPFVLPGSLATG